MIYIADSGSTKCDAAFLDPQGNLLERSQLKGLNPYFHSADFIHAELSQNAAIRERAAQVTTAYHYGAGCSEPALRQIVERALQRIFPQARVIVEHDLAAAVYACYKGTPLIVCILGTGSNCAYYDGRQLQPGRSGYGYIIGDEGSASYIGRQVLRRYLYRQMPEEFLKEFGEQFPFSEAEIRARVYEQPHANLFLASMAPFAYQHRSDPFFYQLVFDAFKEFVETQVLPFPASREVPVAFVGSVALHLQPILMDVLDFFELEMGPVVQRPMEGLLDYHRRLLAP